MVSIKAVGTFLVTEHTTVEIMTTLYDYVINITYSASVQNELMSINKFH